MSETTKKESTVQDEKLTKVHQYEQIFSIVEHGGVFSIAVGNQVISKCTFANLNEAKFYIDAKPWELIINATCCVYDLSKKTN